MSSQNSRPNFLMKTIIEAPGSTSEEVMKHLHDLAQKQLGAWPSIWRVLLAETSQNPPVKRGTNWDAVALGLPLENYFDDREALDVPVEIKAIPRERWVHLRDGGGQMPASVAIAVAMRAPEFSAFRESSWKYLAESGNCTDDTYAALGADDDLTISNDDPLVAIVVGAGGSTGHAEALPALDYWLNHASKPNCLFLALGPNVGFQWGGDSERANAVALFLSLQRRFHQHGRRLATFWLPGARDITDGALQHELLTRETAAMLFDWIATPFGLNLRRRLVDKLSHANSIPQAPRFMCCIDFHRREVDSTMLRRRRALQIIANAA